MDNTTIVWFKNDLRLTDNETLTKAIATGNRIILLYCIDFRNFKKLDLGFPKADTNRWQFLKESLKNLDDNLTEIGGKLNIVVGNPEKVLAEIALKYNCVSIFTEEEYADEELNLINKLNKDLPEQCSLKLIWGKTLYHKNDLPIPISKLPLTSKKFRLDCIKPIGVRKTFPKPKSCSSITIDEHRSFPTLEELGFKKNNAKPYVNGGETKALKRLNAYTFETELLTSYRWTRNKSLGMDYSSKFSPYLALGCISPRTIYETVKKYEATIKKNQSTWWLIFELVWRDFFTFKGMKMGNLIFKTQGYSKKKITFENNTSYFEKWKAGETGIPFVDAHMRQLNETGYMSNRGRVNCASFLVHDYNIDWTWGAAYFESKLIDYDVSANWLNWHIQAYEIWYTNPVHQTLKYKANDYIKKWIPELKVVTSNLIHAPWLLEVSDRNEYPLPIAIYSKWTRSINNIIKASSVEKLDI